MIAKIFEWAWINGLDVRLSSQSYAVPVMGDSYSFMPRREAPNYVEHKAMTAHMPVLVFSRGDRHFQVAAPNWADMKLRLEHEYERIFAELACMPLDEELKQENEE